MTCPERGPLDSHLHANTLILVVLWFRTGLHDLSHRPASIPYSTAYLASAVLFILSVEVDEPARYWLWALALVAEMEAVLRWGVPCDPLDPRT